MRHRPLLAVAASLAGLLALAPAFAADSTSPQPPPGSSASSTTATSAPGSGSGATTPPSGPTTTTTAPSSSGSKAPGSNGPGAPDDDTDTGTDPSAGADDPSADDPSADESADANCAAPEQSEVPAPEVGAAESFDAGDAGTVRLERTSATELHIMEAMPADGWDDKVATPAGPRVKGKFVNLENPEQAVRFAASLNSDGTVMRLKVTDCG